jgi:hypothetical protein
MLCGAASLTAQGLCSLGTSVIPSPSALLPLPALFPLLPDITQTPGPLNLLCTASFLGLFTSPDRLPLGLPGAQVCSTQWILVLPLMGILQDTSTTVPLCTSAWIQIPACALLSQHPGLH